MSDEYKCVSLKKTQSQWKLIRIFAASLVLSQLHQMSCCYSTWVSPNFAFLVTHNDPHLCHITGLVCLRLPSHAAALLVTPNVTSTSRLPGTTDRFSHNTFSNFPVLDKIHHFFWQPDFSFPLVFQKTLPKRKSISVVSLVLAPLKNTQAKFVE